MESILSKNVFAVHGVSESGKSELVRPTVARARLLELIASLAPCLIGMEACSGAHHWAREFSRFGHRVRLMAPKFVAPYRMGGKRGKNDATDAAAICEAVTRPAMRFVPVKTLAQHSELFVHRARQGYVQERTALIRGRSLSQDAADPGCAHSVGSGQGQERCAKPLGAQGAGASGLLARRGGGGGQECAPVLGHAAARRGVQDGLRRHAARKSRAGEKKSQQHQSLNPPPRDVQSLMM